MKKGWNKMYLERKTIFISKNRSGEGVILFLNLKNQIDTFTFLEIIENPEDFYKVFRQGRWKLSADPGKHWAEYVQTFIEILLDLEKEHHIKRLSNFIETAVRRSIKYDARESVMHFVEDGDAVNETY